MSIYDQIANPNTGNFLQNLQIMDSLKNRAHQRRMQEIQAGKSLQQQQAVQAEQESFQKGTEYIKQKMGKQVADFANENMADVDIDVIENAKTYDDIANYLLGLPGQEERSKIFLGMAEKMRDRVKKETEDERKLSDEMMSEIGGMLSESAALEKKGMTDEAAQKYNDVMNIVKDDPRYKDIDEIQEVVQTFGDYKPGLAAYMNFTSTIGTKVREQQRAEEQLTETKRHNKAMEVISDEKNMIRKLKEGKGAEFKSADANAIYRFAVGFHGGMFDEQGNLKLLDPNKAKDVQDLSELAAILYSRGKVKTHNEAISEAAKQLDMDSDERPEPTEKHIKMLKEHPEKRNDFDEIYGEGKAKEILGE